MSLYSLEQTVSDLRSRLDRLEADHQARVHDLETKARDLEMEVDRLKEKIFNLRHQHPEI